MSINYANVEKTIDEIIANAGKTDATYLIPDLQRPYVWSPSQVILLLDSIFKGWPFGSLLTWQILPTYTNGHGTSIPQEVGIPWRPFWAVVDRTAASEGERVQPLADIPRDGYLMILDGQQRIQSLILALASSNYGIKMYDYEWAKDLYGKTIRKNLDYYSKASIYLNLNKFVKAMDNTGEFPDSIFLSLIDVLEWCVSSPADRTDTRDRDSYPLLQKWKTNDVLLRLSDIWNAATTVPNERAMERNASDLVNRFCHTEDKINAIGDRTTTMQYLANFMYKLLDMKTKKICCLEIASMEETEYWTRDSYDNAIVNIFTRLNTAGRELTEEEITFAWLKQGWIVPDTVPAHQTAQKFIDNIISSIKDTINWKRSPDDIIRALSVLWSIVQRNGKLLEKKDFVQGSIIRNIAIFLSEKSSFIDSLISSTSRLLYENGLNNDESFNAIIIAWGYYAILHEWQRRHLRNNVTVDASVQTEIDANFVKFMTRWMYVPALGGKWGTKVPAYMSSLCALISKAWKDAEKCETLKDIMALQDELSSNLLKTAEEDAKNMCKILVDDRGQVSRYRNRLMIWQRMNEQRSIYKKITFRNPQNNKAEPTLEVDHIISFACWMDKVNRGITEASINLELAYQLFDRRSASEAKEKADQINDNEEQRKQIISLAERFINSIGNCSLLNKSYNSSKDKLEQGVFIERLPEFRADASPDVKQDKNNWLAVMHMDDVFLFPNKHSFREIAESIIKRETTILNDLERYITGEQGFAILY